MTAAGSVPPLREVVPDLWETTPDRPAPGLTTHAYLWMPGDGGNVLFYSVATDRDFAAVRRLGGIAHQYLSHRDEAGPMLGPIREEFGALLHAPAAEVREIGEFREPDALWDGRGRDANGVEIVPTPGHSPGSTCFVISGAAGRYLFTGDTLYRTADGSWAAGHLPGISDADRLVESLQVIAGLAPDLVVSSAFVGDAGAHAVDADDWAGAVAVARRALTTP